MRLATVNKRNGGVTQRSGVGSLLEGFWQGCYMDAACSVCGARRVRRKKGGL
jgi:hypothetical protein